LAPALTLDPALACGLQLVVNHTITGGGGFSHSQDPTPTSHPGHCKTWTLDSGLDWTVDWTMDWTVDWNIHSFLLLGPGCSAMAKSNSSSQASLNFSMHRDAGMSPMHPDCLLLYSALQVGWQRSMSQLSWSCKYINSLVWYTTTTTFACSHNWELPY
jgi:hypothetical protein